MTLRYWFIPAFALALWAGIDEGVILPADDAAIQYATAVPHDRAALLDARLRTGQTRLAYDRNFGYLEALLKALDVPAASQILVFSKTSFQAPRIAPRTPRALYHSADVSVGFVQGGDVLEIAATDPKQGVVFYTLDQEESAHPRLVRREECMHCHVGASTLGVPGLVVRSVHADRNGQALLSAPAYVTDHRSPIAKRWGGWYVTGLSGAQHHLGNQTVTDRDQPEYDGAAGSNVKDLNSFLDTGAYLEPYSDIVSLMVLEHQTRMVNLITRLNWESRLNRNMDATIDELLRYMLFQDETKLTEPIRGDAKYVQAFTAAGPRDSHGRSLRDFDLQHRMFRYPCSFLIYSEQFDSLPAAPRERVLRRLYAILTGAEPSQVSPGDRQAVLEILRETKPTLPDYYRSAVRY